VNPPMKRIGLLGGMSWQSTALYYRLLNEGAAQRLGGLHSADCVVVSVDFDQIAALQAAGRWADAGDLLADAAQRVEAAGAHLLLVCSNTMHKVADQIQDAVGIPLLHIGDTTAAEARRLGMSRVGLLGTAFTMEERFYRERIEAAGLEVVVPDADGRELVHRVIYDELCHGKFDPASRARVSRVIEDLVDRDAEGIILGCTEIELLIRAEGSPVPVLPTTHLHAAAALAVALDRAPVRP
jgi:aspartate racemase